MFAGVERFCDFVLKKMGEKIKIKQKKKGGLEKKFYFCTKHVGLGGNVMFRIVC
jgi:hypothetical protein